MLDIVPKSKAEYVDSTNLLNSKMLDFDVLRETKPLVDPNDLLELQFRLHEIIDLTLEGKIEKLDGIESFVLLFYTLAEYMNLLNQDSKRSNEIKKFVKNCELKIHSLISGDYTVEEVCNELRKIMSNSDKVFDKLLNNEVDKKNKNLEPTNVNKEPQKVGFEELDGLYEELLKAIESNNRRKITLCRGRLIKALKKNQDVIDNAYIEVKCLEDIKYVLDSNDNIKLGVIIEILSKEENKKYAHYFGDSIYSLDKFSEKFVAIYEEKHVKKISYYKSALKEELKLHSECLDRRYSDEFLDKKVNAVNLGIVLPNAVGLSVKKLANSINELRIAKTNKAKAAKAVNVVKDLGKVVGTPILCLGNFVVNNWYAFYSLYKGYVNAMDINKDNMSGNEIKDVTDVDKVDNVTNPGNEDNINAGNLDIPDKDLELGKPDKPYLNLGNQNGDIHEVEIGDLEENQVSDDLEFEFPNKQLPIIKGNKTHEHIIFEEFDHDNTLLEDPKNYTGEATVTKPEPEPDKVPEPDPKPNPTTNTIVTDNNYDSYDHDYTYTIYIPAFVEPTNMHGAGYPGGEIEIDLNGVVDFFDSMGVDVGDLIKKLFG